RLTVATARVELGRADGRLPPGRFVEISVTDTGTGMPPAVLERALEPFFTTKEVGRGSGLGLSQVYGITRQCGGDVRIASELGRGTTVSILLPEARAPAPRPAAAKRHRRASAEAAGQVEGTVLVIDDDPLVRQWLVES